MDRGCANTVREPQGLGEARREAAAVGGGRVAKVGERVGGTEEYVVAQGGKADAESAEGGSQVRFRWPLRF